MPRLKLDDVEYHTEDLSENGKAILKSLQMLEVKMQEVSNDITIYQTAKKTYVEALKAEIEAAGLIAIETDDPS